MTTPAQDELPRIANELRVVAESWKKTKENAYFPPALYLIEVAKLIDSSSKKAEDDRKRLAAAEDFVRQVTGMFESNNATHSNFFYGVLPAYQAKLAELSSTAERAEKE